MGIRTATYNQISKSFFTNPKENIKRLSGKIFIPLLIQRKNWASLCASKIKTDLHIHAQRNEGCSLHPSQFVLCMYV